MTDYTVPPSPCPKCGEEQSGAAFFGGGDDAAPVAGDVAVCFRCAELLIYTDTLERRFPTPAERDELLSDPAVVDVIGSVLLYRAEKGP